MHPCPTQHLNPKTTRATRFLVPALLQLSVFLAASACGSSQDFLGKTQASGDKTDEEKSADKSNDNGKSQDVKKDDRADKPARVSGAFLTCGKVKHRPDGYCRKGREVYGFRFETADGKKHPGRMSKPTARVAYDNGAVAEPDVQLMPSDSRWHGLVQILREKVSKIQTMKISARLGGKRIEGSVPSKFLADGPQEAKISTSSEESGEQNPVAKDMRESLTDRHVVFVTAETYLPGEDFSNAVEADGICNDEGQTRWNNEFAAIIASRTQGPRQREGGIELRAAIISNADEKMVFELPDVGQLQEEFWNQSDRHAEFAVTPPGTRVENDEVWVWTGSNSGGDDAKLTCNGWNPQDGDGPLGENGTLGDLVSDDWLDRRSFGRCDRPRRLLCINRL